SQVVWAVHGKPVGVAAELSLEKSQRTIWLLRQPGRCHQDFSARPCITIIVCCISAHKVCLPSSRANTSACVTIKLRPWRTTEPRASKDCPLAGARKLSLYSTLSTLAPKGVHVMAASPPAESAIRPTTPPCTTPCCW